MWSRLYSLQMAFLLRLLLEVRWPRGCAGNGRMFETKEEDALTDSD